MLAMILKMTAVTSLYVLLTMLLWLRLKDRKTGLREWIVVGLIYGGCSVLSTHFGVDYGDMLINVRDLGPLAAGLFFHPVSGVIAGIIGGVERYIAGEFWNIGHYTRIACSLSTLLAGLVPIPLYYCVLHKRMLSPLYAIFIGAVTEVFHMYVVFISHKDDLNMAFYVVRNAAPPMIAFNALGLSAISILLTSLAGKWQNPFKRRAPDQVPLSFRFQQALMVVVTLVFALNYNVAYRLHTEGAIEIAQETLLSAADEIRETYSSVMTARNGFDRFMENMVLSEARAASLSVQKAGGVEALDGAYLDELAKYNNLVLLCIADRNGEEHYVYPSGGVPWAARGVIDEELPSTDSVTRLANDWVVASVPCGEGTLTAAMDPSTMDFSLDLSGLDSTLTFLRVGSKGSFELIRPSGLIAAGDHKGITLGSRELEAIQAQNGEGFFKATMFDEPSYCWTEPLKDGLTLLTQMPLDEVYATRNIQLYEAVFADILLFAVIYMLITMLIEIFVVDRLCQVNGSLGRITAGDLNEVVNVRSCTEFSSLSNDINQTVTVLKGYIDAAKKRIERELDLARIIQDAALPKNFKFKRNDFELFALMDPAKEIGGDFYDFFFVSVNQLALVIADVSGKGIPAALFMMRAKTAIRSLAVSGGTPDEILCKANSTLCEGNDAEMFVTAWLGIIDLTTGHMRCANAGHEYPALMRAGEDYALFKDRHGLALAAMDGVPFKTYELELNPGDRLVVYTDGVPEAINPQEEQYGTDRMLQKLNTMKTRRMSECLPALREDVSVYAETAEQFDDITILGFIYNGPSGPALLSREEPET